MAIVSKLWDFGRATGNYLCEAVQISMDPSKPIPRTNHHARMPAYPYGFGEWFRMFPYRHYWRFFPPLRVMFLAAAIMYTGKCIFLTPSRTAKKDAAFENLHHTEAGIFYGKKQRAEDAKYFQTNDPKAALRPKLFAHHFGVMSMNYYPKGFTEEHH